MICTIGPISESEEMLESLAKRGMNVARLNLCHATQEWHAAMIRKIRDLNKRKGYTFRQKPIQKQESRYSVAVMLDTEGSEVHTSEISKPLRTEVS